MNKVKDIVAQVTYEVVRFRSIRTGRCSAAQRTVPKNMLSKWAPGFILSDGLLVIDIDEEV